MSDFQKEFNDQSILALIQMQHFVASGEYVMTEAFRASVAGLNATCARAFTGAPDPGDGEAVAAHA